MPDLVPFVSHPSTMTSKEVATLTGKRHDNVLRDIDNLLNSLDSELSAGFSMAYEGPIEHGYRYYTMDRDSTYCLMAGYDPTARMRIIKRWQELESAPAVSRSMSPDAQIARDIDAKITLALKYGVPEAHALTQAAQAADRASGTNEWTSLLSQSRCLTGPVDSDRLLEPTELGRLFGISGKAMNQVLKRAGWQTFRGGSWEPTAKGWPFAHRNQWINPQKSGYNLKWSLQAVENLLQNNPQLLYGASSTHA